MGLYDTMKQMGTPASGVSAGANSMGQGFAQQKSPMNNMAQGVSNVANAWQANRMQKPRQAFGQRPNPTMGQIPGAGGSAQQIQAKQLAAKQQQQEQQPGLGPSIPQYQQLQQKLQAQQGGLKTPYAVQQESLAQQQQNPMQSSLAAAQEQMRGYDGPDLGSQDPRELARVGQGMGQLHGQQPINQVPELPVGNYGRPDVMDRGIGPSAQLFDGQQMFGGMAAPYGQPPVQMDENGMEPRRGAR